MKMASSWAEEADRQARAITRDLAEAGAAKGIRVTYQKREARFALKADTSVTYFSAHDYETAGGMDWLQLRIDILSRVKNGGRPQTLKAPENGLI
ncbi:MAG: hypothetical protein M3416_07750 [Acidobacteriota bacterium]|nr:hypothetical protein [Acidobacteriota bacterium]